MMTERLTFAKIYPSNWRGGTIGTLSLIEEGLYWRCCVYTYDTSKPVPLDDAQACRLLCVNINQYRKVRDSLVKKEKLSKTNEGYINKRVRQELFTWNEEKANRTEAAKRREGTKKAASISGLESGGNPLVNPRVDRPVENFNPRVNPLVTPPVNPGVDPIVNPGVEREFLNEINGSKAQGYLYARASLESRSLEEEREVPKGTLSSGRADDAPETRGFALREELDSLNADCDLFPYPVQAAEPSQKQARCIQPDITLLEAVEPKLAAKPKSAAKPKVGKPKPDSDGVPAKLAMDLYNEVAGRCGLPRVRTLTPTRARSIQARVREAGGLDGYKQALANLEASPFCLGGSDNGWRASFDFLCQSKSFHKLLEGSYADHGKKSTPHSQMLVRDPSMPDHVWQDYLQELVEENHVTRQAAERAGLRVS